MKVKDRHLVWVIALCFAGVFSGSVGGVLDRSVDLIVESFNKAIDVVDPSHKQKE